MRNCNYIRPLLFAFDEGQLESSEHEDVQEHIAECRDCRFELEAEHRLTAVLTRRTQRSIRRWAWPAAGLVAATLLGAFLIVPPAAYGSIQPHELTLQMKVQDGALRPLARANLIEVLTGDACTVRIDGVGVLDVPGPAVFRLDHERGEWALTLLRGTVHADLTARMLAVTASGRRALAVGAQWLKPGPWPPKGPLPGNEPTVAELMAAGQRAFFKLVDGDMSAAERYFKAASEHADASPAEKARARFFHGAALGRQKKYAEAVEVQGRWLKAYPEDKLRHYVLLFQGTYLRKLGREPDAVAAWKLIIDEAPKSSLADQARHNAGVRPAAAKEAAAPREFGSLRPKGKAGGYAVVRVALKDEAFRAVADAIAKFRNAPTLDFDGHDVDGLRRRLMKHDPENVLFVVQPDVLDVNLHRRILMMSTKLDDDPHVDFAFGYFTARDGTALARLWERTQRVRAKGLSARRWLSTAVAGAIKSSVYRGSAPDIAKAAGFTGDKYYWGSREADPDNVKFVHANLPALQAAGVITMTGCGDPQGTWLFADRRNAQREKHWAFSPDKVGQDPDGSMPRITADFLRDLKLRDPICWTGVCHAGATGRVFVEGDIVSTFGYTERTELYVLKPADSYCLAMIDAGVTAFFCPIASNHGMSVSRETEFALLHGASLGQTIKSTYDDVALAMRGPLVLGIQEPGKPGRHPEYVMQGGGANRILIGDPSLRPFRKTPHPLETVRVMRTDAGFDVEVTWRKGWHARAWDMYGEDRNRDWCVKARVDLDGLVPADKTAKFEVQVRSDIPHTLAYAEPENDHGRRYLHLQANAARNQASGKQRRVTFGVIVR